MQNKTYIILVDYIQNNQEKFYRVAYSYVKSREDALDIVQESILSSLKSYRKLKQIDYLSTWFYRILINTSINYIRRNKRMFPLLQLKTEITSDTSDQLDLYDALDYLNPEDRSIIILRYFEDRKFKDIAEMMSINISTLKTRHTKILRQLKIKLDWEADDYEQ